MWIRHVASSFNSKLKTFQELTHRSKRNRRVMKSLCRLSARKFLAVDQSGTACDTALTYENIHIRTAGNKEHGRSFLLARLWSWTLVNFAGHWRMDWPLLPATSVLNPGSNGRKVAGSSGVENHQTMPNYPLDIKQSWCAVWVSKGGWGEDCFLFG